MDSRPPLSRITRIASNDPEEAALCSGVLLLYCVILYIHLLYDNTLILVYTYTINLYHQALQESLYSSYHIAIYYISHLMYQRYILCLYHHIYLLVIQYNIIKMTQIIVQITNMHIHTCIYNTHVIATFIALSLLTHMHIHLYSTRHLPNPWHLWILVHHCLESLESPLMIQKKLRCAAEYYLPIMSYRIYIYYVTTH